ncbi:MAG: AsmA family protein [Gemmatimonas sp.]
MRKVLIVVGAVVALLVIAVIVIPLAVPTATWKAEIESRVGAATGRELRIAGPVRLSLFPAVAVVANDVAFANAPGARDASMATLDKLDVHVRLMPLLSGNIAIDRLVLEKPVIHLEVDRQGRPNWSFGAANAPEARQPAPSSQPSPSSRSGGPAGISLGDVRLRDGIVTYVDDRSGAHYEVSSIDATVKLANLDSPLTADGSLVWNEQKVALNARASAPRGLMTGSGSDVEVKLDSKPVTMTFNGRGEGSPLKITGELDLNTPSVRNLAAWAGQPLQAPGNGLGPLTIKGTLASTPQHVSFNKASFKLDAIEASGDLAVDTSGRIPAIKAALTTNVLDLNPYLPPEQAKGTSRAEPAPRSPAQTASPSGWSTDPIDLSGLKAANADLALTVAGLVVREIKIGKAALHVALDDGKLVSDLTEMALYDGNGKARVSVDGSGRVPAIAMNFNVDRVQAQPLLKDAMNLDRVSGAATAEGTISGAGASQRDLIAALNGKGSVKLQNGKIRGLDFLAMLKNVGSAFSSSDNQQTEFAAASATYTVTNGIVRNDDLAMNGPGFEVTGKGTVDLPKRMIDYRVVPRVGVGVPVQISGPWDNMSYRPDLSSAIPDAQQTIRGLRDVFRGGSQPQQQQQEPQQQQPQQQQPGQPSQTPNPLDSLNKLLGR